ncbi:MAG: preprotein translocase subunit SecE [Dehalococcoidales bacterium]|jgi:preprotein translocase SecE subunit|nr:preprotein translocase subunit SecE [Dehalococcoidales bacterium]
MANKPVEKKPSKFRKVGDIVGELKKVTWLTRRETVYLTGMVLVVAVFMAVVLGLIDWGFSAIIDKLFIGG